MKYYMNLLLEVLHGGAYFEIGLFTENFILIFMVDYNPILHITRKNPRFSMPIFTTLCSSMETMEMRSTLIKDTMLYLFGMLITYSYDSYIALRRGTIPPMFLLNPRFI